VFGTRTLSENLKRGGIKRVGKDPKKRKEEAKISRGVKHKYARQTGQKIETEKGKSKKIRYEKRTEKGSAETRKSKIGGDEITNVLDEKDAFGLNLYMTH